MRGRHQLHLLLAVVAAASAIGCGPDEAAAPAGASEQPIVNGTLDNGDPAVVALTGAGQAFCSGTLITPMVVLTAAHCLPPNIPEITSSYSSIDIFFGSDVYAGGDVIGVADGWTNPQWSDQELYYDIGLLRLTSASPVTPIPHNTSALSNGAPVRIIGFGVTSEQGTDSGRKREGAAYINGLETLILVAAAQPATSCYGDSGGTTVVDVGGTEHVAGIVSRGDCISESINTRVDGYLDDINAFLGNIPEPSCMADGQCASGCPEPDPDCPCADDGHCTAACSNPADDPDCDGACPQDGFCDTQCATPDPDCSCAADGHCDPACTDDPDCGQGDCAASGDCDWTAGNQDDRSIEGVIVSSCAYGTPRSPTHPWLLLLGLVGAALRRRASRAG